MEMDILMRATLTILGIAVIATACGRPLSGAAGTSGNAGSFRLSVMEGTWDSLRLGYDVETSWPVLQHVYSSTAAFTVTVDDVAGYDWANSG